MDNELITEQEQAQTSQVNPPVPNAREAAGEGSSNPGGNTGRGMFILVLVAALALGYVIYTGITSRAQANTTLHRTTLAMSVPTVAVVKPKTSGGAQEVLVPGNMQAFMDTPIWARSSGYLKNWHADIGAHVKTGQLLAEIESPETGQQLQQAREDLSTAQANLKLAEITADRYTDLFKTDSVAKQDVDNAVQSQAAKTSGVSAAQANVRRLEQLVGYEKIYAPFDGVITQRNTDVGALIGAGASTSGRELFHLASTTTLRVYVNVPEIYEAAVKPGVNAYLTLSEFAGKQFHGVVVRNANAIDPSSRTLLVEVDVKNPNGELLPGSYVSVHLKLPSKVQGLTVPDNALLFRSQGLQVAVVRDNRTQLVPVVMGRDLGDEVELLSGIGKDDAVIVNPSDSIVSGLQVQIAQ